MRKSIVIITALLTLVSCSSQKEKLQIAQKIQNIENGLVEFRPGPQEQDQVPGKMALSERMAYYKVPGVSIAVINNNKIEWAKVYGTLNAETGTPVTTESIFQAASTSKLITAVILLYFVEKGKIDLDENLNNFLKSWKIPDNDFTREKKVTLRLLLTHQSGLPTTNFDYDEKVGIPTLIQVLKNESPAQNKPAVVEFAPGSKWQYSNIGYDVLQLLVEDITSKPFNQIAQEIVFEPLGMKSSTFVYPLNPEYQAKEALPHDDQGIAREPMMHHTALAHGGLMTTPSDLARLTVELMHAYRGKSSRVLSQDIVKQMFHQELELDPKMFGLPIAEGLGVFLLGKGLNFSFSHPGSNLPGTTCWLQGFPGLGKGVVIMANGVEGELLNFEILSAITNEYGWPGVL